jgi:RNA polymerase sigma factor (sigma-70 family)
VLIVDDMRNLASEQTEMTHPIEAGDASSEPECDGLSPQLFERLNNREVEAIETAFQAYEPQLRMVVRRQIPQSLRAKFDTVDVVQSVWASVLQGLRDGDLRFTDESHLRSFLIRLALFRFIDLCRHHRLALGRERPLAVFEAKQLRTAPCDRPTEILKAEELLDRLMKLCPPSHHELLRLRAMGLPVAEIAARTGFHAGSIRRIFHDLKRRFDAEQEGTAAATKSKGA